jgi:sigma-B regulation protein RsbU (phosphoserine phosphatase)
MLHMGGTVREIALDVVDRQGGIVPVLVNAVAERSAGGDIDVVRVAVFDATHRRRYEQELLRAKERAEASEARASKLARTLQRTLIPPTPPLIPHLDLAAVYRPAGDGTEVGGDFYDVFRAPDDNWFAIIGDVCGKGADAAVVTALARYTLRATAMETVSPAQSLRRLNDVMLQSATDRFCTAAMVRLWRRDPGWQCVLAVAGHPLPLVRRSEGAVTTVGRPGTVLGVVAEPAIADECLSIAAGDALVLYTDGLPDARVGSESFGEDRVVATTAQGHPGAAALAETLVTAALDFQGGTARDDIAVVVLRAE